MKVVALIDYFVCNSVITRYNGGKGSGLWSSTVKGLCLRFRAGFLISRMPAFGKWFCITPVGGLSGDVFALVS